MRESDHLPHYTYEDYRLWEGRWELIRGIPYAMTPSPGVTHQRVSHKLAHELDEALSGCEHCMGLMPVDWKVSEETVVQPDNMVICYRPESEQFLVRAPSLIFEILSPSTAHKDRTTKYEIYEKEGVDYYGIVDPENRVAKIYALHEGRYVKQLDARDECYGFDLGKCRFELNFGRIWPE